MWVNLEDIMLIEISQTQRDKYYVILLNVRYLIFFSFRLTLHQTWGFKSRP